MTDTARTEAMLVQPGDLAEEAVALVRRWLAEGRRCPLMLLLRSWPGC